MNYTEGQLLSFTPFFFKSGAAPKKKYFIVLKHIEEQILMASLPTSKDRIPSDVAIQSGCINHPERAVNAFVFMPKESVTERFAFPLPTFVYGEQVDEYSLKHLETMDSSVEYLGTIHKDLFSRLKACLKQSVLIKRKYSKLL